MIVFFFASERELKLQGRACFASAADAMLLPRIPRWYTVVSRSLTVPETCLWRQTCAQIQFLGCSSACLYALGGHCLSQIVAAYKHDSFAMLSIVLVCHLNEVQGEEDRSSKGIAIFGGEKML